MATAETREELQDLITLVLRDGSELRCQRVKLAEASPVFRAMLNQDCEETRTNRIKLFQPETVETFFGFIKRGKKIYDKRLTLDLLRLCHMYDVKDLQDMCAEYLEKNILIADANVVEIWSLAETFDNKKLKERALDHLGEKKKMMDVVPGLRETLKDPHFMESLVNYMSAQMKLLAVELERAEVKIELNGCWP